MSGEPAQGADVQDASVPQEAPPAPDEGTPQERAAELLFRSEEAPAAPEEAATPPEPEAPAPPAEDDADTRLSRLYAQTTESEQSMRRLEAQNRELATKLERLEAFDKALSADPTAALRERGLDPQELIKKQLGLDDVPPTAEEIAQQALSRVAQFEEKEQAREAAQAQQRLGNRQTELQGQVQQFLKDNGFDALGTSVPAVANLAKRLFDEEQNGDFNNHSAEAITGYCRKLAENYDAQLSQEVRGYVSAEGALDKLLADEATAKLLRAKFGAPDTSKPNGGQAPDAADPGNEPRTISDQMAAQSGSQSKPDGTWDADEAMRRAAAVVAKSFAQET